MDSATPLAQLELNDFKLIMVLAEELHFGRAARRLGATQPGVSQRLKRIEDIVGAPLFWRTRRSVALTPIGEALAISARKVMLTAAEAVADARSAAGLDKPSLRLGLCGGTLRAPVAEILSAWRRMRGKPIGLAVGEGWSNDLAAAVRDGSLDVAVLVGPIDEPQLQCMMLARETAFACVAAHHRLARLSTVPTAALRGEPLILFPPDRGPGLHAAVLASCRAAGFEPSLGPVAMNATEVAALVAAGEGVGFVLPGSTMEIPGIVYIPMAEDAPALPLLLAWDRNAAAPHVKRFVAVARHVVTGSPQVPPAVAT